MGILTISLLNDNFTGKMVDRSGMPSHTVKCGKINIDISDNIQKL